MSDFTNRADWENTLTRALVKLQDAQRKRLIEALGDPPDLNKIEPTFWNETSTAYREALYPLLEGIFLDGAAQTLDETSIGADWNLVNESAARWARQYTYELVTDITDKTRRALGEKVGGYFETPTGIGDLKESLAKLFDARRAEMIAVTEVTRAASYGAQETVKEIERNGIAMLAYWHTNNDSLVCPMCGPRNGKAQGDGWNDLPPAHPNCRCWVAWKFADEAKALRHITIENLELRADARMFLKSVRARVRLLHPEGSVLMSDSRISAELTHG